MCEEQPGPHPLQQHDHPGQPDHRAEQRAARAGRARASVGPPRARREVWIGSAVFTVLVILEAYLGGLIRDDGQDTVTAVHVSLAMALLGLAVWLPFCAARTK